MRLTFCHTPPHAFEYGLLGISSGSAESLSEWTRHVERMARAFELMRSRPTADRERAVEIANEEIPRHVEPQLVLDPESRDHRPVWKPKNLLGAMWMQLACTFDTDARFPACMACGRTMLVAPWLPGGRRGQSKYCDNACTQRAKRMKAKAKRMLEEGAGRRRVARELGVPESWLGRMGL